MVTFVVIVNGKYFCSCPAGNETFIVNVFREHFNSVRSLPKDEWENELVSAVENDD
jgi:hypothetical protein